MKSVLLFSVLLEGAIAQTVVSSDRFLLRILDRTISLHDFQYQQRNLKALNCIYPDALVVQYFGRNFLQDWSKFLEKFPANEEESRTYLHAHQELLKNIRIYFKILRYAQDQKTQVTPELEKLIREGTKENKCDREVLHKDTLKTNFISLLQVELYLRARYGSQVKGANRNFEVIKSSIDLFAESLDKQFLHEYYW